MNLLPEKAEEPRVIEAKVDEVLMPGQLSVQEKLQTLQAASSMFAGMGLDGILGGYQNWFEE